MGKRLSAYVKKKTTPKKPPSKPRKSMIKKRTKITASDIEAERIRSGYTGKMTPYIKEQLKKKAKARKIGN